MKYSVKCSECGSAYDVALFGPHKKREYALENYTWICDECTQKLRKEMGARAAEENAQSGLPALTGSEKQIQWAEQIRAEKIKKKYSISGVVYALKGLELTASEIKNAGINNPEDFSELCESIWSSIKNETSASWWIEHRYQYDIESAIAHLAMEVIKEKMNGCDSENSEVSERAVSDIILEPETCITKATVEIGITEKCVYASLPEKIEVFRLMVKSAGFFWERDRGRWECSGPIPEQRAAWIGFKALAMGIRVLIHNPEIREKVKSGDVKSRWITSDETHCFLRWWDGAWYDRCKKLAGSKWERPYIKVPLTSADEILDFAETEGWGISEVTRKRLDIALASIEKVSVSLPDQNPAPRDVLKAESFELKEELKD